MTPSALLAKLAQAGVEVVLSDGENLRLCGPSDVLTTELVAAVKERKTELLHLLSGDHGGTIPLFWPSASEATGAFCSHRSAQPFMTTVNTWPPDTRDLWEERAAILEYDWDMSRDAAEREAFNRIAASSSPEPAQAPASAPEHAPACGHTDTVTVIHVDGYGALCGACWTRWVAGGMNWPGTSSSTPTDTTTNPAGEPRHNQGDRHVPNQN